MTKERALFHILLVNREFIFVPLSILQYIIIRLFKLRIFYIT